MRFLISPDVAAHYPELRIGVLLASGLTNGSVSRPKKREAAETMKQFAAAHSPESVLQDSRVQLWRSVYAHMGVTDFDRFKPTIEYTLERVAQGEDLRLHSKVVAAYLLMELKFFLPCGGYDLAHVTGDIHLRLSAGGESFLGIGQMEPNHTDPNEIVYADEKMVLTRVWNFRDADATKLTNDTTSAVLMIEAPTSLITSATVTRALEELQTVLQRECGGTYRYFLADVSQTLAYGLALV